MCQAAMLIYFIDNVPGITFLTVLIARSNVYLSFLKFILSFLVEFQLIVQMSAVIAGFLFGYSFKSISKAELGINCSISVFILLSVLQFVYLFIFYLIVTKLRASMIILSFQANLFQGLPLRLVSRNHVLGTEVYSD